MMQYPCKMSNRFAFDRPTVALSLLIIVIAVAYYAYARHMETKHAINPLGTKAPN